MPRTTKPKKTTRAKKTVAKTIPVEPTQETPSAYSTNFSQMMPWRWFGSDNPARTNANLRRLIIVVVVVGLALLVYYKRSWFVAATVNGSPISNFELLSRLNSQFRTQMLNQMVNEKIIFDEAKRNNVQVSDSEIDQKISEYEKNVGGKDSFDALLEQQGQTRDSLREQIKIQLTIEKLYGKEATVSADEVNKFIADNKSQLTASDSAGQQKEATDDLKQQKLSDIFRQKFQSLRDSAKIQIY